MCLYSQVLARTRKPCQVWRTTVGFVLPMPVSLCIRLAHIRKDAAVDHVLDNGVTMSVVAKRPFLSDEGIPLSRRLSKDQQISDSRLKVFPNPISYARVRRQQRTRRGARLTSARMPPYTGLGLGSFVPVMMCRYLKCRSVPLYRFSAWDESLDPRRVPSGIGRGFPE